jgi:hypothetical protein
LAEAEVAAQGVLAEAVLARRPWGEAARVSSLPPLRRKQTARVQK